MQWVKKIFERFGYLSLILLALIPAAWPKFSEWEGYLLPVTTITQIRGIEEDKLGIRFYTLFVKRRSCEFISVNWYRDDHRLSLEFTEDEGRQPLTRPVGAQFAGPWVLGTGKLEGTNAIAIHRCHPLWLTYTQFYP